MEKLALTPTRPHFIIMENIDEKIIVVALFLGAVTAFLSVALTYLIMSIL
ncbi:hypothetical protein LCGC14_3089610 [marine sediment metagenome]|uniref:Uncharacterized protein n=1 Tax=marine sediment metagenome TaxID=412755 RepID=A0A0F8WZM2_9ZZZZ